MTVSQALRAAEPLASDHAESICETVRVRIGVEDPVLTATADRRDRVRAAAEGFPGVLATFPSGSLAHRTVNNPVSDADAGARLDRRFWTRLGPDGHNDLPEPVMHELGKHIVSRLRVKFGRVEYSLTKRAIVFEFHEPIDDEDPSVDLVICLTRQDQPGYWSGLEVPDAEGNTNDLRLTPSATSSDR